MANKLKQITKDELSKHNDPTDLWVAIHGKVYDVTRFSWVHPGGTSVLVDVGGTDATTKFDDIGHSPDAKDSMPRYVIGELVDNVQLDNDCKAQQANGPVATDKCWKDAFSSCWVVPIGVAIGSAILYRFFIKAKTQ